MQDTSKNYGIPLNADTIFHMYRIILYFHL